MSEGKSILAVISGPAGSGKTTLIDELIARNPGQIRRAVTATTRPPRPGEINGRDYHFLSRPTFEQRLADGYFLEHNLFNGNHYGTPGRELALDLDRGGAVILVIDVNGAEAVRRNFPAAVLIFVIPPTLDELRRRLEKRGTEEPADLKRRLAIAEQEISAIGKYDFLVVNAGVAAAIADLEAIIRVCRRSRPAGGEAADWRRGLFAGWD
jgi:guanylate kinase